MDEPASVFAPYAGGGSPTHSNRAVHGRATNLGADIPWQTQALAPTEADQQAMLVAAAGSDGQDAHSSQAQLDHVLQAYEEELEKCQFELTEMVHLFMGHAPADGPEGRRYEGAVQREY